MSRILITGASGFLGKNLAEKLMAKHEIVLTSRNQKALSTVAKHRNLEYAPLDVSDFAAVLEIFQRYRPEVVIHAAASKFVDLAEKFPNECLDSNVRGSQNVARAAIACSVGNVIGISTDKAAPPIANIYGLSKATMEKLFCSLNFRTDTDFSIVRYGNVAWSTGSVFPIWRKMIDEEREMRTTGPDMSRFFFTIDEAVNLVETCLKNQSKCAGKILSLPMKGTTIKRILDIWSDLEKVPWKVIPGRVGDRKLEYLIGEFETEFTELIEIQGRRYFLMDGRGIVVEKPLENFYSSVNASQLTDDDIRNLIHAGKSSEL